MSTDASSTPLRRTRDALTLPALTDRHAIADTPLRVSPFCLGAVADPNAVLEAYDAGINFFFLTADMHWPYYEGLRRGLAKLFERGSVVRDSVVVSVVSYVTQPEFCFLPFEEVIHAVKGLERVDLSVIGGAYAGEFLVRLPEYRKHLLGAVRGVKALGCSFHDRVAGATVARHGLVDVAYVRYNALHPGAEHEIFPAIDATTRTLLYNFKSTDGHQDDDALTALGLAPNDWRPHVTDHYRFVLRNRQLDGVLCSLLVPAHVRDLADAMARGPLDDEEVKYFQDVADLVAGNAKLAK